MGGDVIEDLVVGAECTRAKPYPDPYLEGMKRLGVGPECCVVFEDSRSGIKAGLAAGVTAIVGIRTSLSDAELREAGCAVTVADWTELTPALLTSLLRKSSSSSVATAAVAPATTTGLLSAFATHGNHEVLQSIARGIFALTTFILVLVGRGTFRSFQRDV